MRACVSHSKASSPWFRCNFWKHQSPQSVTVQACACAPSSMGEAKRSEFVSKHGILSASRNPTSPSPTRSNMVPAWLPRLPKLIQYLLQLATRPWGTPTPPREQDDEQNRIQKPTQQKRGRPSTALPQFSRKSVQRGPNLVPEGEPKSLNDRSQKQSFF